jgi:glutathione S-transferase
LDHLASALSSTQFLLGDQLTAADLVVYAVLLPLQLGGSFSKLAPQQQVIDRYLGRVAAHPAVKAASEVGLVGILVEPQMFRLDVQLM